MPGIMGFTACDGSQYESLVALRNMRQLLTHQEFYVQDKLYTDGRIWATRVHNNSVQTKPQPHEANNVSVWLEGEIYNRDEVCHIYGVEAASDLELLAAMYGKEDSCGWLADVDGIFAAVLYDISRKKLILITDRYGLRHLYLMELNGCLIWASEVKAALAFPDFVPEIDENTVDIYFSRGYMLGDLTWFKEMRLLEGATILTWDFGKQRSKIYKYWSWNNSQVSRERFDEDEIIEELEHLFRSAVERRCSNDVRLGVALSGGLDSRAIVAALPAVETPVHSVTFGKKDSDDVIIAERVAELKGLMHHVCEIERDDWLEGRFQGIWWLDGQLNLMHMHGLSALRQMIDWFTINLNGFLGDAFLGGWYLEDDEWSEIEKFENRGRRFVYEGIRLGNTFLQSRLPFMDKHLIEFMMAIPEELRSDSYIYNKMLLRAFPDYYQSIPWQKTGLSINHHPYRVKAHKLTRKGAGWLRRTIGTRLGLSFADRRNFVDYQTWLRQPPARQIFQDILVNNPSPIYPEFISRQKVRNEWESHLAGQNKADLICRYLTFEVWLQQVYAGKYRDSEAYSQLS